MVRPGTASLRLRPEALRPEQQLEAWRDRIWQVRHKFLTLLHPQFRDMTRKLIWSMDQAGLRDMPGRLLSGLLFAWLSQGTTQKMEDFLVALLRGEVFLLNDRRFLPDKLPANLATPELLQSLLVYDPVQHSKGVSADQAIQARLFFAFLRPSPESKPWIKEWISEMAALRRQASAELGEETAKQLWGESGR